MSRKLGKAAISENERIDSQIQRAKIVFALNMYRSTRKWGWFQKAVDLCKEGNRYWSTISSSADDLEHYLFGEHHHFHHHRESKLVLGGVLPMESHTFMPNSIRKKPLLP